MCQTKGRVTAHTRDEKIVVYERWPVVQHEQVQTSMNCIYIYVSLKLTTTVAAVERVYISDEYMK